MQERQLPEMSLFSTGRLICGLALLTLLSLAACSSSNIDKAHPSAIVVQGSDTMAELMHKWADSFMKEKAGVQITVENSDTGAGVANLIAGKADIAAASRELTASENELAHSHAVHLKRVMVARDAVAVIVNPQNKVSEVGLDDLRKIFLGELTTWGELNGDSKDKEPVRAFGREASSGTSDYFREHVMEDKPFGGSIKLMPSSEAVIGGVYGNRLTIGFVGMAQAHEAADKVKVLKLKLTNSSPESKQGGGLSASDYPLSRPLYIYYDGHNESKVESFVQYCTGDSGQKIVSDLGFMSAR